MFEDYGPRSQASFNVLLRTISDQYDYVTQREGQKELDQTEADFPGFKAWVRDRVWDLLHETDASFRDRAIAKDLTWKADPGSENPDEQLAIDFWAYIWDTISYGEPWPADLPPADVTRFDYMKEGRA